VFKDPELEAIFAGLPNRRNPLQVERLVRLIKRREAREARQQLLFGPAELDEHYRENWEKEHPSDDN
jgi:hypothetical protein